jgi:transcriptional regulator with XRE-family HTH domain
MKAKGYETVPLLEALRHKRGLTVQEAAALAGISAKTLRRLEHLGPVDPRSQTLHGLAKVYGVQPGELLDDYRRRRGTGAAVAA